MKLPEGWTSEPMRELGSWTGGGTPSKRNPAYWESGTINWFSAKDMKTDFLVRSQDLITEEAIEKSSAKLIPANSILFVTRSGILEHTLPIALTKTSSSINQDLKALTLREGLLPEYIFWAAKAFAPDILRRCWKAGTTVASINTQLLMDYPLPIAPTGLQRRIVEKIEELFTKLDAGVDALHKTRVLLERYRQAVLKAAVTGELTGCKRIGRGPESSESCKISGPLFRILEDSTSLPKNWKMLSIKEISKVLRSGGTPSRRRPEYYEDGEIPFAKIEDIVGSHGRLRDTNLRITSDAIAESSAWCVPAGSVLYTMYASYGIAAITEIETATNQAIIAIVPDNSRVLTEYLYLHLEALRPFLAEFTVGTTQPNLSKRIIQDFMLAVPPLDVQQGIVDQVDRLLNSAGGLRSDIELEASRVRSLRSAVLEAAFSGSLVGED